ncbi:hypothetical protein [Desulforamulus aquiferis]|uniref:Uncharacterized protein n=1 Tax=Desulforamulus aquiferis TaxID=1397668 RepID=A0AAW7ZC91_9FIRM|nr:hypothetical protein [Desulforamulus aquiferis]MDO7786956.1 hypothetical protein [Desulforamulus aquiferis]RYD03900.1 hypothetical protein N752_17615 [Desulforamulus aquiferis]
MFGDLKLLLELQNNRDDAHKLMEIFYENREKLLNLKEKYPEWQTFLKPEVLETLRSRGIPVD